MPSIRVGFSTDLNITGGLTGIGTTNPAARLDVAGQITVEDTAGSGGVSTFREYQGFSQVEANITNNITCLLYTSPSPRDLSTSRMPSSA